MGSKSRKAERDARPGLRRPPAAWLRRRLLVQLLVVLLPLPLGIGIVVGARIGPNVPALYLHLGLLVMIVLACAWLYLDRRWSVANLERGMDAEYRMGQVIDYALVPRNCAVAHGVVGIAAEGDIDHLVATPQALWVVETKVRAVPKGRFPAVVDRIARNVHAVEAWAPDTPARGCLALLEPFRGKRDYQARDGTPVVVHDERSLRDALRAEALAEGAVGAELAHRVWQLGRVTPTQP